MLPDDLCSFILLDVLCAGIPRTDMPGSIQQVHGAIMHVFDKNLKRHLRTSQLLRRPLVLDNFIGQSLQDMPKLSGGGDNKQLWYDLPKQNCGQTRYPGSEGLDEALHGIAGMPHYPKIDKMWCRKQV